MRTEACLQVLQHQLCMCNSRRNPEWGIVNVAAPVPSNLQVLMTLVTVLNTVKIRVTLCLKCA